MMRWRNVALFACLVAAACSGGGSPAAPTPTPPPQVRLPAEMRLSASASGETGGQTVTCAIDFVVTLREAGDEMHGAMGGDAQRARLNPDGSGEQFWADAHYPEIRIGVDAAGRARLRSFRNGVPMVPTGESRFWDAILGFEGVYDRAANTISGTWTCRPLDVRTDTSGDVAGTWTLRSGR